MSDQFAMLDVFPTMSEEELQILHGGFSGYSFQEMWDNMNTGWEAGSRIGGLPGGLIGATLGWAFTPVHAE